MTNTLKILAIFSFAAASACSSGNGDTATSTTGGGTGGTTTGGAGSTTGIPAVPTLGTHEIDRMGRPAINTALTAPLNTYTLADGGTIAGPATKDLYNQVDDPTQWAQFDGAFAGNLAVFDALDTVCGNQTLANYDGGTNAAAYGTLAAVLADDELYVDTSVQTCILYLGTELEAIGAAPAGGDCGGRTLTENVIDVTYSALATGKLSGVTNGVTQKANARATTTFPFLGTP